MKRRTNLFIDTPNYDLSNSNKTMKTNQDMFMDDQNVKRILKVQPNKDIKMGEEYPGYNENNGRRIPWVQREQWEKNTLSTT